ncbi:MAG TPA: hemerythrin [Rhodospirillaceae bacterium]|nr:hemerythrin [Rhodospirillaceae bacterium]
MAFLDWSDILSVHYRLIDADHKKLIDLINRLHDASVNGDSHAGATNALKQLMDFTKAHFVHEETLMRKTAYPQIIPHKIEHDRLTKQLEDFLNRFESGQAGLSQDTVVFLRTWLCDHIIEVDIHLGRWLAKFEAQPAEVPEPSKNA